jgi:hypothetical protein
MCMCSGECSGHASFYRTVSSVRICLRCLGAAQGAGMVRHLWPVQGHVRVPCLQRQAVPPAPDLPGGISQPRRRSRPPRLLGAPQDPRCPELQGRQGRLAGQLVVGLRSAPQAQGPEGPETPTPLHWLGRQISEANGRFPEAKFASS